MTYILQPSSKSPSHQVTQSPNHQTHQAHWHHQHYPLAKTPNQVLKMDQEHRPIIFQNETNNAILSWDEAKDHKTGHAGRYQLPLGLTTDLVRYMFKNNIVIKNGFSSKDLPNDYYRRWGLNATDFHDQDFQEATNFFKASIKQYAKNVTTTLKAQGGLGFDKVTPGRSDSLCNGTWLRGYEHIMEDDWDGKLKRRFVEVDKIFSMFEAGRDNYTDQEVEELGSLFTKELDRRKRDRDFLEGTSSSRVSPEL